jgi:dTMP kinase
MATFFSFDGIDGAGKSTQLRLFCQWLRDQGRDPVICRDPGSTPLGERVRDLLLNSDHGTPIGPTAEMLLYMAARAQLVDEIISPSLNGGRVVVSDRFLLANIVYQGYGARMPLEPIRRVGAVAVHGLSPDCTFLLDIDVDAAIARLGRPLDRVESRGADYWQRLRDGFLAEAAVMGPSVHVIAADRPPEEVQADIRRIATATLAGA